MKNKKAQGLSLQTIVIAILLLVVLFLVIWFFAKNFGSQAEGTKSNIECMKQDKDNDGVNDFIDDCCESPSGIKVNLKGCGSEEKPHRDCNC